MKCNIKHKTSNDIIKQSKETNNNNFDLYEKIKMRKTMDLLKFPTTLSSASEEEYNEDNN